MGEFGLWEFWSLSFTWTILVLVVAKAAVVYTIAAIFDIRPKKTIDLEGEPQVVAGMLAITSTLEELWFRWLLFYLMVPLVKLGNWATFGLEGWIYRTILMPVADFTTFGFLGPQLDAVPWVIGAAMLAANASFRNGHKYQGPLGYVNSWFGGMIYFYALFNYGIGMAILAHITYNLTLVLISSLRQRYFDRPAWA